MENVVLGIVTILLFVVGYFCADRFGRFLDEVIKHRIVHEAGQTAAQADGLSDGREGADDREDAACAEATVCTEATASGETTACAETTDRAGTAAAESSAGGSSML